VAVAGYAPAAGEAEYPPAGVVAYGLVVVDGYADDGVADVA
jgi:hypothetical protein